MTTIDSFINKFSIFTMALLEDSGWYKADYNYADEISYGKNEGCDFVL